MLQCRNPCHCLQPPLVRRQEWAQRQCLSRPLQHTTLETWIVPGSPRIFKCAQHLWHHIQYQPISGTPPPSSCVLITVTGHPSPTNHPATDSLRGPNGGPMSDWGLPKTCRGDLHHNRLLRTQQPSPGNWDALFCASGGSRSVPKEKGKTAQLAALL